MLLPLDVDYLRLVTPETNADGKIWVRSMADDILDTGLQTFRLPSIRASTSPRSRAPWSRSPYPGSSKTFWLSRSHWSLGGPWPSDLDFWVILLRISVTRRRETWSSGYLFWVLVWDLEGAYLASSFCGYQLLLLLLIFLTVKSSLKLSFWKWSAW